MGLFTVRVGLFPVRVGLFLVGGGLFPSPPVTKKSPTPTEKSPTVISKRCWTLEYSGELEFSSPFMEQWTLDARGVLLIKVRASHNLAVYRVLQGIYELVTHRIERSCQHRESNPQGIYTGNTLALLTPH